MAAWTRVHGGALGRNKARLLMQRLRRRAWLRAPPPPPLPTHPHALAHVAAAAAAVDQHVRQPPCHQAANKAAQLHAADTHGCLGCVGHALLLDEVEHKPAGHALWEVGCGSEGRS